MTEFTMMHCGECGIEFSVPEHWRKERKETGKGWHCPNGHARVYRESDLDKMRLERDRLRQEMARVEEEKSLALKRAIKAEAETKSIKKRAAAGVCPCCKRTVSALARHMETKHPEFVKESKVVHLKTA
jgi:hypothetical protein